MKPLPERATGLMTAAAGEPLAKVPATVRLPVAAAGPVGVKITPMVQVRGLAGVPAAKLVPQEPPERENSAGKVIAMPFSCTSVFDNVSVCTALATPCASNPKFSEVGDKLAPVPVPVSVTGEPTTVALDVTVRYAMALPGAVGENATLIVHVPPSATGVAALQVPPAATANIEPVENAASIPVTGLPLELVRVTLIAALVAPTLVLGKVTVEGDTKTSAAPVPLSATGDPPTVELAPMLTEPFDRPDTVGANVMLMVQLLVPLLLAANVPVQVPPVRENPVPVTVTVMPVKLVVVLGLDNVSVCVADAFTATLPNDSDVGYTFADVERSPVWNSIAPASNLPSLPLLARSGRGFP